MAYPNKPQINKHGTIKYGTVETTPIVYNGKLYRFEYCRPADSPFLNTKNYFNKLGYSHFFFIDMEDGHKHAPFAKDHHLGCAYTDNGIMYAMGVNEMWGKDTVDFYRSTDLDNWEQCGSLHLPGWRIYNTGVCKMNGVYTLLMEINAPVEEAGTHPFTFRFATSTDMCNWTLTPRECVFQKDRYAGGPAIYADDGWYYVFYLEHIAPHGYINNVARSRDLIKWDYSAINPVLMYDDVADKKIINPYLTEKEREVIKNALDINNSDFECCEFNGRTIIYYSWGNQRGMEFLAEASYEGTMHEFLSGWFE